MEAPSVSGPDCSFHPDAGECEALPPDTGVDAKTLETEEKELKIKSIKEEIKSRDIMGKPSVVGGATSTQAISALVTTSPSGQERVEAHSHFHRHIGLFLCRFSFKHFIGKLQVIGSP